jgi:alpha-tubulin suppressor-like RCC1 family protein
LEGKVVVAAAAGLSVSGAITADGLVYTWGSAGEAMLGKPEGDDSDEHFPRKIEGLKGAAISMDFGGQHAALLVSADGGPTSSSNKRQR